jgi:diadenosine tetraphosphatase ApaH/serine/threonine PP2A family protein phosphatase
MFYFLAQLRFIINHERRMLACPKGPIWAHPIVKGKLTRMETFLGEGHLGDKSLWTPHSQVRVFVFLFFFFFFLLGVKLRWHFVHVATCFWSWIDFCTQAKISLSF